MAKAYLKGDWKKAGITLKRLSASLFPLAKIKLKEDGDYILEVLQGHIDAQDLPWVQLSESTIKQKKDGTIYVETGELRDGFVVRQVKSSNKGSTLFIGASPWKRHSSGLKMSELMLFLEYGTSRIPPRPLIRPVKEEVESYLKDSFPDLLEQLIK